jgi:hypothetical protein
MIDARLFRPLYNYEEQATLAYQLCPSLTNGSRGVAGPDLLPRSSLLGPLKCPSGSAWARNSARPGNDTPLLEACCNTPGTRCYRTVDLSQCYLTIIADYVTNQGMERGPPPMTITQMLAPSIPHNPLPSCATGREFQTYMRSPAEQ